MKAQTIDLMDIDAFVEQRHYEMLSHLREHDPVYWNRTGDDGGFWAITRYDDVVAAYTDHASFSSEGGAMLGGSYRNEADTAAGHMLVASDPPRHRILRQQMHRIFANDFVDRIAARVRQLVATALDQAEADGGCDFATQIAPELPAGALMEIAGVTHEQAHELIALTRQMIGFRDPFYVDISDDERLRLAVIQAQIFEYFSQILLSRTPDQGDDLFSILLRARINGRPLSEEDILYNCMNMAVGGNETSSYSACAGVLALTENPEQDKRLREAPELLGSAVSEILRWSTTNAYVQRVATQDVTLGGKQLKKGDSVTLWNVSANRDESQFAGADQFRVDRSPNRHISYGSGVHRCIGSVVAQVELPAVFDQLVSRRLRFRVGGEVARLRSNFIQGITSLPLEIVATGGRDR
jgi:cytochrome P450